MNETGDDTHRPERNLGSDQRSAVRRFELETLMQGSQEAVIIHNGEHYRLRITSNGKLILTK